MRKTERKRFKENDIFEYVEWTTPVGIVTFAPMDEFYESFYTGNREFMVSLNGEPLLVGKSKAVIAKINAVIRANKNPLPIPYTTFKERQKKKVDDFIAANCFFAFTEEDFKAGAKKLNASPENKLISIGAGGFILAKKKSEMKELLEEMRLEKREYLKNDEQLKDAIFYELGNHEYNYTYDATEALDALSLSDEYLESVKGLKEKVAKIVKSYRNIN